jgi:hypothetical protein
MDKILQLVQAASLAPSSGNIQNWSFIIVTEVQKIRDLYAHAMEQEQFLSAMSAVIVVADLDRAQTLYGMRGKKLYAIQNAAAATQNLLLAAHALGLGASWIGAFDEDHVSSTFSIPDGHRPQAIVLLGYPARDPDPKPLAKLDELVFFNTFGNRVQRPHLVYFDWATEWKNQAAALRARKESVRHTIAHALPARKPHNPDEPTAFEESKRKLRDMIEQLKKDEYRKR